MKRFTILILLNALVVLHFTKGEGEGAGSFILSLKPLAKCLVINSFQVSGDTLTLKVPNKNCSRRHFIFLLLYFEENKA